MILIDANILIYAFDMNAPLHKVANAWLDRQLNGFSRVGIPWQSFLAFARIVTNPRIFERPAPIEVAWNQVLQWLSPKSVWVPHPTEEHGMIIARIIQTITVKANDSPDIHLAALALEHGLKICSTDSDFSRFPDIVWVNPLMTKR